MNLKKDMGLLDVFSIALGAMLGSLFILPGLAYQMAGPAMILAYLLAGVLAFMGQLSQLELASAMPKAGGTYFYVTRSMGDAVGTVYGLITWLSLVLKSTFELAFMAGLLIIITHIDGRLQPATAMLLCLGFLSLNVFGAKEAGHFQMIIVLCIVGVLGFFCIQACTHLKAINFEPFAPNGFDAILPAAGFVFVSFGAILKITSLAEEVRNPGKTIPRAMIMALAVVFLIYLLVVFAEVGAFGGPFDQSPLDGAKVPLAETIYEFAGTPGMLLMNLAALLAIFSSVNSGVMAASRYPLALARDEMLPGLLARVHSRYNTPHFSLILTCGVMAAAIFFDIKILVKAASAVLILTYIFCCLAVIILRESHVQNYRPQYRAPFYPWLQIATLLGLILIMIEMGIKPFLTSCVLMALGFVVYWFYGRAHTGREYALLHIIERITDRQLTDHHLETELKDIIHERDEVLKDHFDHLVEQCQVLDLEAPCSLDEFFRQAAARLEPSLGLKADTIYQLLDQREKESPTVLSPFLAIPHIVIWGEHHFNMLLARCRGGIQFSEKAEKVHAVFILMGTKDERPTHLQALAAICQIAQDDTFEQRWLNAKNQTALRDILLLSKRKRLT